jgi:hypothetical protein
VQGLRREEVAQLAAISTDYHARLEQGRLRASPAALAALARALRLDNDQREYLYAAAHEPAGIAPVRPCPATTQELSPVLARILSQLTESPAYVMGRHLNILGWNALEAALFMDFSKIPKSERNAVRLIFAEKHLRHFAVQPDWETMAANVVGWLRFEATEDPEDPCIATLVRDLSADPIFRALWSAHEVNRPGLFGPVTNNHPTVGLITLTWEVFLLPAHPEQRLYVGIAEPNTPSDRALKALASGVTTPAP